MLLKTVSLAVAVSILAGCGHTGKYLARDSRDAAWDPPPGRSLFEQLPNWDGEARRRCGGHLLPEQRSVGMTDRC